jgi:hypothetical protein
MADNNDLMGRAQTEISAMAKQGMDHPSTKPVLIGAGVGAVAGALLPFVSIPLGLAVSAGYAFWQRIK